VPLPTRSGYSKAGQEENCERQPKLSCVPCSSSCTTLKDARRIPESGKGDTLSSHRVRFSHPTTFWAEGLRI